MPFIMEGELSTFRERSRSNVKLDVQGVTARKPFERIDYNSDSSKAFHASLRPFSPTESACHLPSDGSRPSESFQDYKNDHSLRSWTFDSARKGYRLKCYSSGAT